MAWYVFRSGTDFYQPDATWSDDINTAQRVRSTVGDADEFAGAALAIKGIFERMGRIFGSDGSNREGGDVEFVAGSSGRSAIANNLFAHQLGI